LGEDGGREDRGGVEDVWMDVRLGFTKLFRKNDSEITTTTTTTTRMIACKRCIIFLVLGNMHLSRRTFKVIGGWQQ
jgi:hypothetical protein